MKVLLVDDNCPGCETAKKRYKKRIESGEIRVMNVSNSATAREIARQKNVKAVPKLVEI